MRRLMSKPRRPVSMHDHSSVRGVRRGPPNKKRTSGEDRRRSVTRAASIGLRILGTAAVAGLAVFGVHSVRSFVFTSPRFALERIEVVGAARAQVDTLIRLAGLEMGENLFKVDLAAVSRAVEAHPWVDRADVRRQWPRGLVIEVSEHEPVVLVSLGHLYYANAEGDVVKRYAPGERVELPVVTGLTRAEMESDDGSARLRLRGAIDFVLEARAVMGEEAERISEIHVDPLQGLSFSMVGESVSVMVGDPPWRPRVERFLEAKKALKDRGVQASRIILSGERRSDRVVAALAREPVGGAGQRGIQGSRTAAEGVPVTSMAAVKGQAAVHGESVDGLAR